MNSSKQASNLHWPKSQQIDILREDFSQTLDFIDKCDVHIFKIKNWALITSSAVIAFAISQDQDVISLLNLVLLLGFIYLELIQKSFQNVAIEHSCEISKCIDRFLINPDVDDFIVGYNHSFGRKLRYPSVSHVFSILANRNQWHILNFYGLLSLISIGAFVVAIFVS